MGNAPDAVKRLVDRFDQDRKVFLSGDCQAGTRDWGLGTEDPSPNPKPLAPNPYCAALGWDMDNKQGLSETFKQVIHEESLKACPERSEVWKHPSVDFGALWRYISLHYEENHGHSCDPR